MSEPVWILREALMVLHDDTIAQHGGISGVRDAGALESALTRAQNTFHYENQTGIAVLAANYAFGIAKNHPFADGNKRSAFIAAGTFLRLNGLRLTASQEDATRTMYDLAGSKIDESAFADWLKTNSARL
jgi:death-on-curing protein